MSAPKSAPPVDLASLEHAFAADPSSDAWRPLTEAYLSMGRFMEDVAPKVRPLDPDLHLGQAAAE